MKTLIAVALAGLVAVAAQAQTATPAGLWKTIDDHTGQERSLVRITQDGGTYSGRVEKVFHSTGRRVCDQCTDERKDQPIVGMTILRNVRQNANEPGVYDGGDILDPENGKVYRVRLKPVDAGRKLEVRGYIGMPLLGRTQTWIRVE